MRTILWAAGLMLVLAGCTDDSPPPADDPPADDPGPGDFDDSPPMDNGTADEPEEDTFEPVYINGTLTQSVADCSGPPEAQTDAPSHDLPDDAQGRSYDVTVVEEGDVPAESICVSFDGASASESGFIPEDATSITVAGDFAVGTAYSIYIH